MYAGLEIDDDILTKFNKLKMNKAHRYMILKILDDNKRVIIYFWITNILKSFGQSKVELDQIGNRYSTWKDMLDKLDEKISCFAFFDYAYSTKEAVSRDVEKLLFVYWCPEYCKPNLKITSAICNEKCNEVQTH